MSGLPGAPQHGHGQPPLRATRGDRTPPVDTGRHAHQARHQWRAHPEESPPTRRRSRYLPVLTPAVINETVKAARDFLRTHPKEAEAMIAGDLPEGTDAPELAAWSSVSRVLLNLDEFITRE